MTEAILARIERLNPVPIAYVTVSAELALEAARASEARWLAGKALPLDGVPISIKDLTVTKGVRTTFGSLQFADWVPDYDAPFVERIKAAGAVMLGKTNTPERGWKGESSNPLVRLQFAESVAARQNARWIIWRRRGGRGDGAGSARPGERWRGLDPHSGRLQRHFRSQALIRADPAVSAERGWQPRSLRGR